MTAILDWLGIGARHGSGFFLLAAATVRITVLLLVAAAANAMVRRASAAVRHSVWLLGLAGVLAVPVFSLVLPSWDVPVLEENGPADADLPFPEAQPVALAQPASRAPAEPSWRAAAQRLNSPLPATAAASSEPTPPPWDSPRMPTPEHAADMGAHWSWTTWVLWGWFAGLVAGLVRTAVGLLLARRYIARAQPIRKGPWLAMLQQLRGTLRIARPVQLREGLPQSSPITWGWLRPVIVVPAGSGAWPADRKRVVLLHELGHIRRCDWLAQLVGHLACRVWWFHPLVWLAAARGRRESDQAADDLVLSSGVRATSYAEQLLQIAANLSGVALLGHPLAAIAHRSELEGRVIAILDRKRSRGVLNRTALWALLLSSAGLIVPLATLTPGYIQAESAPAGVTAPAPAAAEGLSPQTALEAPASTSGIPAKVFVETVDAKTGKPIAGAPIEVILFHQGDRRALSFNSDDQGRSTIEIPAGLAISAVVIESKPAGRVPVHYRWDKDPPPMRVPDRLTFRFHPGTVIGGRVVDESGRAIAGAKVEVLMPATQSHFRGYYYFHPTTPATLATDADGRWRTDAVPEDLAGVGAHVEHPDFLPGAVGPDSLVEPAKSALMRELLAEANVLRLEQGVTLTGRVLGPDGKPIAGASAAFGRGPMEGSREPQTKTDAQGRFELKNCRKGPSAVTVQAEGFAPQMIQLAVGPDAKPLEFRLQPGATIRARVVDPRGKPLFGARLRAYAWPVDKSGYGSFHAIRFVGSTDAEGRLAWTSAPPDPVVFHVSKTDYMTNFGQVLTASPREQVIALHPRLVIQGAVTDAETGKPIEKFRVKHGFMIRQGMPFRWDDQGTTASGGRYVYKIAQLAALYKVRIEADGYEVAESREFEPGEGPQTFDFRLKRGSGP